MKRVSPIAICALFLSTAAPAQTVALKAGRVVDPETGKVTTGQVILVEAGKIKAIGADVAVPKGAEIVDLSNATVLPGLIDAHTHLCLTLNTRGGHGLNDLLKSLLVSTVLESNARRALVGVANAREMLEAGFTTVRDVGNAGNYADTELRRAIEDGLVPGPTILNGGASSRLSEGNITRCSPSAPKSRCPSTSMPTRPTRCARPCARTFSSGRR